MVSETEASQGSCRLGRFGWSLFEMPVAWQTRRCNVPSTEAARRWPSSAKNRLTHGTTSTTTRMFLIVLAILSFAGTGTAEEPEIQYDRIPHLAITPSLNLNGLAIRLYRWRYHQA
jgi:hypothetical protein